MSISPSFDPLSGAAGGALLAVASSGLLLAGGQLVGVSGFVRSVVDALSGVGGGGGALWQGSFLAGLLAAGAAARAAGGARAAFGAPSLLSPAALVAAGLAVGAGTALASGCTSGHGLCGLARLSPRSLAAVGTFMAAGAAAASAVVARGGAAGAALTLADLVPAKAAALVAPFVPAGAAVPAAAAAAVAVALLAVPLARRLLAPPPAAAARAAVPAAPAAAGAALAFASSLVFGAGLLLSGMTRPAAVQGFLAPLSPGGWDPTLAFVMGSGVLINIAGVWLASSRSQPPPLPLDGDAATTSLKVGLVAGNVEITPRLLLGSALFGLGWGAAGVCPGPAVVALGALQPQALIFVPAMLAGVALVSALTQAVPAAAAAGAPAAPAPAGKRGGAAGTLPAEAKGK